MSKSKVKNLFKNKFGRAKSTTDLSEWSRSDEKLMKAVEKNDVKRVAALLSKKTLHPTKLGSHGRSVFHVACAIGNEQIIDMLLKETEDVNDLTIQGNTALQLAAAKGHTYTVERLLQSSASVDLQDSNDMTALHHACAGLHIDCVKVLLAGHADPHAKEQGGKTPLFYSAHRGGVEICKWLLDKGADINSQDMLCVTPLMIAAKEGHKNVCEFLLKRGANPDFTDREGNTALNYALASGHLDMQEIFDKAPLLAFGDNSSISDIGSSQVPPHYAGSAVTCDPVEAIIAVESGTVSDDETASQAERQSVHSMDDKLLATASHSPLGATASQSESKTDKAYRELKEEHDQLNEDYSALSVENLRLRDKVESLQTKLNEKHQQDMDGLPAEVKGEIRNLKSMLDEEKEKNRLQEEREQTLLKQIAASEPNMPLTEGLESGNTDNWADSEDEDVTNVKQRNSKSLNENQMVAMLRSQILTLRQENEQLKGTMNDAGEGQAPESEDGVHGEVKALRVERDQLMSQLNQLKEESTKQLLSGAISQEGMLSENASLSGELEQAKKDIASLQLALEAAKNETPTDAQRLDAILAGSKNIEEVSFDEEGFVEGRDMTKEEFLQAQNQQLKTHCGLLTAELEKLRSTFDAILKAGDNLQADYDQLASEKDSLQDELEVAVKEKAEVVSENEFLLTDNNALHEDLKKLVHELEKMQERLAESQAQKAQLQQSVNVASKVGEVARLLEERDALQQSCDQLEVTSQKLQQDHGFLLEEVQSLNESVSKLTAERDQLSADLEEMEPVCQQHEALQQDYSQLELDFEELLRDKQGLEKQVVDMPQGKINSEESSQPSQQLQLALEEKGRLEAALEKMSQENSGLDDKIHALEEEMLNVKMLHASSVEHDNNNRHEDQKAQEEIIALKKKIACLNKDIAEWEQKHADTVSTYRTHLLSAVQGHMDPDVKDALYHIIELRSMEQFC